MVKNLSANAVDISTQDWSLGWEDSLEEGMAIHSNILAQRIPMDRGARRAAAHRIAHSWTWLKQLSMHAQLCSSELFYYMVSSYFRPQYKFLWDFKGRNEVKVKTLSCVQLCKPIDCSLPGSSVHGIFQAIVLEWIAISFSRGSSQPRAQTRVSHIVDRPFTVWATREVCETLKAEMK